MEFKCVEYDHPDIDPVSIVALDDVLELHKKRIVAKTRAGQILILRYLRWCDFVRCSNNLNANPNPEVNSMREELACIQQMPKERLDADKMERAKEIDILLRPYAEPFLWACIESPSIRSADAMNALYMSMDVDERLKLDDMLSGLTAQIPNAKLDGALKMISEKYNVPIISSSELIKLTYQQVVLLCPLEEKR